MSNHEGYRSVLRDVLALARREQITLTAGSIAYFSFVSLIPLLLLLVALLSVFGDWELTTRVVVRATRALTPESAALLQEIVFGVATGEHATLVSGAILLWGALLTFRALNSAFGGIYDTYGDRSLLVTVTDIVVVLIVIMLTVLLMVVAGGVVSVLVGARVWETLWPLVRFGVLVVVFFPLYYVLPDVDVTAREAVPGTVFAAGAWSVLRVLFGYYVSVSTTLDFYGAASTFLLILLWLYVGGFVLLVGAILNAVLAEHATPEVGWLPSRL